MVNLGVGYEKEPEKKMKIPILAIFQKPEHNIKNECFLGVHSKVRLSRTIIAPVIAFQRKSIILLGTAVVTLKTV